MRDKQFPYYDAKNIVKGKTCVKSKENPSCINLIITNSKNSFNNTTVISTGLSDQMALTALEIKFTKTNSIEIIYQNYKKNLDQAIFRKTIEKNY